MTRNFHPPVERIRRWLHGGPESPVSHVKAAPQPPGIPPAPDPGHAPGHRHLGPPPEVPPPHTTPLVPRQQHHPAWLGGRGRVDRLRRNERHGDEKE